MDPSLEALLRETGWLARLARSMSGDFQRAEDAVQETVVAALERRGEARRSLRGWLRTVLRSKLVQSQREHERRIHRERSRALEPTPGPTGDVHERLELQEIVARAVRGLEEPYRSTIVARYFDDLTPKAIATRDGLPLRTVHTRLERAQAQLRARLAGRLGEDRMRAWLGALAVPASGPALPANGWSSAAATIWTGGTLMGTGIKLGLAAAGMVGLLWLGLDVLESGEREVGTNDPSGRPLRSIPEPTSPSETMVAPPQGQQAGSRTPELSAAGSTQPGESPGVPATALSAPTGMAELRVHVQRESDQAALAGADIEVTRRSTTTPVVPARPEVRARTDEHGNSHLRVPSGQRLRLSFAAAEAPQHPVQEVTLEIDALEACESRALEVALPDGLDRLFHGRVVAAEDGRPLPEAVLLRQPSRGPMPELDARGGFVVSYASWTPDEIEVRCPGFAPLCFHLGRVDQAPGQPYVVALDRPGAIEARVGAEGECESLALVVRGKNGSEWKQNLDPEGRARIEELPVRTALSVELQFEGIPVWRDPEAWSLSPGERRRLDVSLAGGCLLFGTLFDETGRPVADHGVVAFPANEREGFDEGGFRVLQEDDLREAVQALVDGRGGYEFGSLSAGRWWIGPKAGVAGLVPLAIGVEIRPGSHARRLHLHGEHGQWIRGIVLGPDGKAMENCRVIAQRGRDRGQISVFSSDGRFEIGPLMEGDYDLRAFGPGVFGWGDPVRAHAGDEGVELPVGRTHTIGGQVVDEAGRGVRAHVHLLRRNSSLGTSTTDAGTFLFTGLEPGTYGVTAAMPDGRAALAGAVLEADERVEGLVLELQPGARVVIRHDLTEAARVSIWCGETLAADFTVRPGVEGFEIVPAGPLRVELHGGGKTLAERSLVARPERVETIEF